MSNTQNIYPYQFKPFAGSSHAWAIDHLKKLELNASLLDIGPGGGEIAKFVKDQGISNLYAVEVDQENLKRLKEIKIYQDVVVDISELNSQRFDCILLLDVLEHMAQPFEFYNEISNLLKPGGIILISLPNVAHWSIRLSLLFGYFEYTSRGILDQTHLQFFSRRRFTKLITQHEKMKVLQTSASIEPVEFVLPTWICELKAFHLLRELQLSVAQMLPGFFAYQHLALLKKLD